MQTPDELAATANRVAYDSITDPVDVESSPHIRHVPVRALYARMAAVAFERARTFTSTPAVLDLGAGDGAVTRVFIKLGARVTAVDVSELQLETLAERNADFAERLTIECGEAAGTLARFRRDGRCFDVITAVSFLHHVPDYLAIVRAAVDILEPQGQLITFQDPMSFLSMRSRDRLISRVAYVAWRLGQPDAGGGFRRYLRRRRGVWLDDCPADNVEYHELRGGVDQSQIRALLEEHRFQVDIVCYFSAQSPFWQRVGDELRVRNKFALVATRSGDADA